MLVGLHGISRSGKDSIAAILVQKHGFRQIALATAIRKMLLDLNPWLRDDWGGFNQLRWMYEDYRGDWDKIKAASQEAVDLMIRLGQSARDTIGKDVWIAAAFPQGYNAERDGNIVISDIRQPNEVEFLYSWGGELWYVERPGPDTQKRGMDGLLDGLEVDAHIVNDGTLQDLEKVVRTIIEESGVS